MNPDPRAATHRRNVGLLSVALVGWLAASASALDSGSAAPEIGLASADGKVVRMAELRGKVVVVDFWATWCAPCREELPVLDRLHASRKARGLVVVGVNLDREARNMRDFLARAPVRFPVVHDVAHAVADRYHPSTMPSSYLVDRRGVVRFVQRGFRARDAAELERRIDALLAE